ncbi:MAG: NAD+ synthase [Bacteroidales bacterium]|nr:NAD+ synthase [Bacteroidales bacterium]
MKIALAQLNFIVGDFSGNMSLILQHVRRAKAEGADLVIFSELAICGYPPLDLLESGVFVDSCIRSINHLAKDLPADTGVIIGGPEYNDKAEGKLLYNSAYFLLNGKIEQTFRKSLLPTYDIFDEYRYFEPNREFGILEYKGEKIAVTICEDLWDDQPVENRFSRERLYTRHPLEELMKSGPDFVINIAASPFAASRMGIKQHIFTNKAKKHRVPVFMVNQVGANTELIFEGGSLVASPNGTVYHQLSLFNEDLYIADLDDVKRSTLRPAEISYDRIAMMNDGLALGVRDYFHKSGFTKATLGMSGGIDSAVTLAIATQALGSENLHILMMPSQYSSDHSVADSEQMAKTLGVRYDILSIRDLFDLYRDVLKPVFGNRPEDISEENIQSRIRATLLMALSNKHGHILLNTSNKSETAVGYGTIYGDMAGGLSVLGDVYKVDVYALAKYMNRHQEIIPENIIAKPPSAELRPGQKDADSLPGYDVLDAILELYIEKRYSAEQIAEEGFDHKLTERVIRMVNTSEYKRYQTPPILRISSKAFGVGRRIPIVGRY